MHATATIERPVAPDTYPPIHAQQGSISPMATAVAGVIGGAVLGAGYVASRKIDDIDGALKDGRRKKEDGKPEVL
jgi:hypothetical protein